MGCRYVESESGLKVVWAFPFWWLAVTRCIAPLIPWILFNILVHPLDPLVTFPAT